MAETNILWVQERFDPEAGKFQAVDHPFPALGVQPLELMRLPARRCTGSPRIPMRKGLLPTLATSTVPWPATGGVEDDEPGAERNARRWA